MDKSFSTIEQRHDSTFSYWNKAVADTYFDMQLCYQNDDIFNGQLESWDLSTVQLSRMASDGAIYKRLQKDCSTNERQVLVTVPVISEFEFSQMGRTTRCEPGQFLLELSEEPFVFGHSKHNEVWVLKIPVTALRARIGEPKRFCARSYGAQEGVGGLLGDYFRLMMRHRDMAHDANVRALMGTHFVDLLAMSLQNHPDALQSSQSAVRDAHLARIEEYVRLHLCDPDLSPDHIAQACGISLRYLHLLFKGAEASVCQWIREKRLQSAHEMLRSATQRTSIAQIAYAVGFSAHAQFSNAFRKRFGHAPSEIRPARSSEASVPFMGVDGIDIEKARSNRRLHH